jgi:hypothetical protein
MAKAKRLGLQIIMARSYSISEEGGLPENEAGAQRPVAATPIIAGRCP